MPIVCVEILAIYNQKLLLMLRNNEPLKNGWFIPGGRVFHGETLDEALLRVLKEETSLESIKIEQKGIMTFFWPEVHIISIMYHVEVEKNNVKMNSEHRDFKWVSKITEDNHPYLIQMIKKAGLRFLL